MFVALSVHLLFVFLPHYLPDEPFYATIPYRLLCGDSLIQEEWHLSQLSSFFTYLPVRLWITVKGSADGLFLFLRLVYLLIHTAAAVVIYRLFRTYQYWAIVTALIYYLQTPYKIYAMSYNSMFAFFLLLFSVCLYLIYRYGSRKLYFISGVFFAACCIGNPVFVITLPLYPILSRLLRTSHIHTEQIPQEKKKEQLSAKQECAKSGKSIFCKPVFLFLLGIGSVAAAGLIFFFGTGGELSSLFNNLRTIADSSEYRIVSGTAPDKIKLIVHSINRLMLNRPYYIFLYFIVLINDTKAKQNSHRIFYLLGVIPLSVLCILGMRFSPNIETTLLHSFPCALLSLVCYILTEKRNKPLFLCMWCPSVIASLIQLYISNTLLTAAGFVLAVSNVSGVILIHDLFQELRFANQKEKNTETKKQIVPLLSRIAICVVLILQIGVYVYILQYGQPIPDKPVTVSKGPYSGIVMSQEQSESYNASLRDLDLIREKSSPEHPVLITSFQSWMYLYLQRPIATYTTWYAAGIHTNSLTAYYAMNPDKIPKYIYVVYSDDIAPIGFHIDNVEACIDKLDILFDYTTEELSNGLLLTVKEYHGS